MSQLELEPLLEGSKAGFQVLSPLPRSPQALGVKGSHRQVPGARGLTPDPGSLSQSEVPGNE